ncbi:MAG: phenylacetate--CoA ligase family protein [Actinobacteria bacterium]|nr:phenylacetate--CoA ligase family protein [Actinomycetota bacterium]
MIPITPLDEWTARRIGVGGDAQKAAKAASSGVPLSRSDLEHWQLAQLREVVAWSRDRSPLYRDLYEHLPPDTPQRLSDLGRLPFVQQEDLRRRGLDFVCVSQSDIARVVTIRTSGSTGVAKRLWFTEDDLELTIDHFRHGMRALVQRGQRVLVFMPGAIPGSVGDLLNRGLARDGVEVEVHGFVNDCGPAVQHILEFEADCLVGVPGQMLRLARSRAGRTVPAGRVKAVLFSGDYVAASLRTAVEDAWDCSVFEHYGSTETGLGGAVQCQAFSGLHIREADLIFEVIDRRTGEVLPLGETGELVVTTLTRRGMPLIRYRTGDSGKLLQRPCVCGSVLRCLDRVQGRLQDAVEPTAGVRLTMADLDETVYGAGWVVAFSAELVQGGAQVSGATPPEGSSGLMLWVEVCAEPPDVELKAMIERIEMIPAVRRSGLQVNMEVVPEGGLASPAKRKLLDSRRG